MAAHMESVSKILKKFNVNEFKPEQQQIFDAIWCGRDCVAVLPTGYGKFLPYQVVISVKREEKEEFGKIIVCCPLISLMEDQVHRIRLAGDLIAVFKGESEESDARIKAGSFDVLFASPETLVGDKARRSIIQQLDVSLLVVDEFHTVTEWGEDKPGEAAFLKWFSYLGELRALFPGSSLLALSATCLRKDYKKIIKVLQVREDAVIIRVSPNKNNIKILSKRVKSVEEGFYPVVEALTCKTVGRVIIYCQSIKDVSDVFCFILAEYLENDIVIEMYHSETMESQKNNVRHVLRDPNCRCIIVATSALGMGLDVVNCISVTVFGLSKSIVDLLQQIGRVGRDGSNAEAMLLYKSAQLRAAPHCVKAVYITKSCRRSEMMESLMTKTELSHLSVSCKGHIMCCDNCASTCVCGQCDKLQLETLYFETKNVETESSSESDQTVSYRLSDSEFNIVENSLSD